MGRSSGFITAAIFDLSCTPAKVRRSFPAPCFRPPSLSKEKELMKGIYHGRSFCFAGGSLWRSVFFEVESSYAASIRKEEKPHRREGGRSGTQESFNAVGVTYPAKIWI